MNLNTYQELAGRTHNKSLTQTESLTNYALGLTGEAGEVADQIKKHVFHGHQLDRDELKKELGDVLWYIANLAAVNGIELAEVAELNINKLKKRYPEGFSQADSINREDI
ncbi:nucleoside triphosphate pyrophosphohydrolase family protein [Macrococcus equipercicus]|uniref:Nucleoside triphosphate pyrophosphohydrolase family protein n=1 Tax=Macrococcus equipercicus TaxID=69967 RepID=A0A9Q9BKK3_9STAP|nr:nucleoside triphosphate pyrophosphohydrolase family protein [Macrococcus equipercicus]UTH13308.1 nucleoside triphosphate pyrophosphohydrolase family protein [Macrococcus equipercicus]